jgi:hypothetical protein
MGRLEEVPSMKRPRADPPVQIYWISKNARSLEELVFGIFDGDVSAGTRKVQLPPAMYALGVGITADRRGRDRQPFRESSCLSSVVIQPVPSYR